MRRHRGARFAPVTAALIGIAASSSQNAAQTQLEDRLSTDTIALLGAADEPFSPSPLSTVAKLGRYFAVGPIDGMSDAVVVYESDSEPWLLGGRGNGPGEFRGVDHLIAGEGLLHVFSDGRETVFNDRLEVNEIRHIPTVDVTEATLVENGSVILHLGRTKQGIGYRLLRLGTTTDSLLAEFELPLQAKNHLGFGRILGPSAEGGFWIAVNNRYVFEKRSSYGRTVQTLDLSSHWFPSTEVEPERVINPLTSPPPPVLVAMREDQGGHLWVASCHPSDSPDPTDSAADRSISSMALYPKVIDSIVEVLDSETGRSLARRRIPGMVIAFLEDDLVAIRDVGPFDITVIRIEKLHLEERIQ